MRTITANNSPFKITVNKLTLGMREKGGVAVAGRGKKEEEEAAARRGPDGDGGCWGAAAA